MSAPSLDETQAAKVLRHLHIQSRQQWQRDGERSDLNEYVDAGMAALAGCLARFDPSRGIQFHTYAAYRITGAVRDAAAHYQAWRHGVRVGSWKHAPPNAAVLRPLAGRHPDPVLRRRLLREVPTLSRRDGDLLQWLLAGEELVDIAKRENTTYQTIYMRYRHLLQTLRHRLAPLAPGSA